MRLTQEQRHLILAAVHALAGADARVRLFGSRTDDALRGGDIDLLVELPDGAPASLDLQLREVALLEQSDARLFAQAFDEARAARLVDDIELAERKETFAARFGRLQDTVGDKLLPRLLAELAEPVGAALDNLARAERLGWVPDAERWLAMRRLRDLMVHEYIERATDLAAALTAAHGFVDELCGVARAMTEEVHRPWSPEPPADHPPV